MSDVVVRDSGSGPPDLSVGGGGAGGDGTDAASTSVSLSHIA
jgi:hypothetical protein